MRRYKSKLIGVVLVLVLSGMMVGMTANQSEIKTTYSSVPTEEKITVTPDTNNGDDNDKVEAYLLDHYRRIDTEEPATLTMDSEENDAGYNIDVGNDARKALPIYPGEIKDGAPGRGTTGQLDPTGRDTDDWYYFSVCEGQKIKITLTPQSNFDLELLDSSASNVVASSTNPGTSPETVEYTADSTGRWFMHIYAGDGATAGEYSFDVRIDGQNDANSGKDAGNSMASAMHITPGQYFGYMDANDWEDWYSFDVNAGQGIKIILECPDKTDYDIHLYNPSGEWVYSAQYYGDDTLEYPADVTGEWYIKLDIFPGWDTSKWPEDYFLYGSGAYEFELIVGESVTPPPGPVPQPDITPVAQTFIINNDDNSNKDEYAYIAAIPAANYIEGGKRYVSPIVYQGVDKITNWFGTVDDTTQYLLDDWNTYLARHGVNATEYILPNDPIKASAQIATTKWTSSSTAVLVVDGSEFEDEIETIVDQDATLNIQQKVTSLTPDSPKFKDVGGVLGVPMFIGPKWGAIHLIAKGSGFRGDTGVITPRYEAIMEDWWPYPYDFPGPDSDTFFPIVLPGLWVPYVTNPSGLEELQIIKYTGDRYKIPISDTNCSIKVTITTDEPTNLVVYLIDPYGNVRRPSVPHWNGGEIKPIHQWMGGHWEHDYDNYRRWIIEPHTEFTVEVHYPMKGKWTAIVVPFYGEESGSVNYHITAEVRHHNPKRVAAGLSAANGAVIASLKHAPLLYVKEDSIPSETSDALSKLGVSNIIFVNIGHVSSASPPGSVTEYTTMQEVVDAIKEDANSENFITITSFATGEGYFAPAAMAAAYHGSPVLSIGEAAEAYDILDKLMTWREYGGDYYHGCRSLGHLPHMHKEFNFIEFLKDLIQNQSLPPPGFDLKKRWYSAVHDGIYEKITAKYGLDLEGQEAYLFVSPRDKDIRDPIGRCMTGNESYAGQIPVETPAFSSALICRNILYPAIIFANPGRNVTTSQLMNFPDGGTWRTNDGKSYQVYSSRTLKQAFSSHGRFYEGHCIWDNLLKRYNEGVSISYYSGHGTGGSGISAQYKNVAEQFPLAEVRHEHLKDFDWWDAWRGYMYDDKQTKTARWGGFCWYNAKEPNLYDIIHFKWVDQLLENLHSEVELWMSCTTAAHFGPMIYLEHGAVLYYGNAGTGLCPQEDLLDDWWIWDFVVKGEPIGQAFSKYVWLHQRDYTTDDPTAMYGSSSMSVTNVQCIFGDPTLILYSPEWVEPEPVMP
ncbi:MAG: hypothetical protein FE047_01740 [Thermoplasmata archaeon]|nr:MAG: hypothetical protein FE047_01740 [Thermoplasmata archaeon]